jgi:hypothetical protein
MRSLATILILVSGLTARADKPIHTDLLIVGATESGWAAAIQAARQGVKSITLVHDGAWLGGQYTEQSLACVDENKGNGKVGWGPDWHPMKRSFHRSGLFKELMDEIESFNEEKYGSKMPGIPIHGPSTFRPADAEAIFRKLLRPYIESGHVHLITNHYPVAPIFDETETRLVGLKFASLINPKSRDATHLNVHAPLTIDASDFGDAIQVSGTAFEVGPDPQSRYDEPSAPKDLADFPANEMNPITWAMIVEETDEWSPIPKPANFDDRNYPRATHLTRAELGKLKWDRPARIGAINHWPDQGQASTRQLSVFTVRRIVDGYTSKDGMTSILLNYMNGQDYALERLPKRVVDALEATEPGASEKNYVLLNREQRQIIFEDAKRHSLGVLHHLQNFVHERAPDKTHSFRKFRLSREFGTADNLPPKPYIRESLRLKAMYMMREQDGRNFDGKDKRTAREGFAKIMYPDGVFSWQFHYDFHRTGRTYLQGDADQSGPWIDYEKPGRHTRFVSDRSVFPLRSLIPEKMDGLIGAQRNVGNSSIVSAAIRLHDQGVHVGQAAGALAAVCLKENVNPRDVPLHIDRLESVRDGLCGGTDGSPMLLWPYRDLPADHPAFVAINRLAAQGAFPMTRRAVDFQPDSPATMDWRRQVHTNSFRKRATDFNTALPQGPMTRAQFALRWWGLMEFNKSRYVLQHRPGDFDDDGIPDARDPLPFSAEESSWPPEVVRPASPDADGLTILPSGGMAFNFTGRNNNSGKGFIPDHGFEYTTARGHGWTQDISPNNRRRGAFPEPHRDTFIFTRTADTWECQVDSGSYEIRICVGDSGHEQAGQWVHVEDQPVIRDVFTDAGIFFETTVKTKITDGRLTVRIGKGKPGSNTCLNWLTLKRLP